MREIDCNRITETVSALFQEACIRLPGDVLRALEQARKTEESDIACGVLDQIIGNVAVASTEKIPLCQDTGAAVVFLAIGQDVHVVNGNLTDAVNRGVQLGYTEGYLRKSMVACPYSSRKNTG
ncbi:MAG: fumarate hydratase, partial [Dehalococcoidales bacterium]|nr:fumarate hydratase [Dehalococcoidales bacterium]